MSNVMPVGRCLTHQGSDHDEYHKTCKLKQVGKLAVQSIMTISEILTCRERASRLPRSEPTHFAFAQTERCRWVMDEMFQAMGRGSGECWWRIAGRSSNSEVIVWFDVTSATILEFFGRIPKAVEFNHLESEKWPLNP